MIPFIAAFDVDGVSAQQQLTQMTDATKFRELAQGKWGAGRYCIVGTAKALFATNLGTGSPLKIWLDQDIQVGTQPERKSGLEIELIISPGDGTVSVAVPISSPHQLFWRRVGAIYFFASHPSLIRGPDSSIDSHALYSLAQFGAVFPPFSIWNDVKRVVPGKITEFSADWGEIRVSRLATKSVDLDMRSLDDLDQYMCGKLDECLKSKCVQEAPVIAFSGGVDSGLLAARAAELGFTETLLLHHQFDSGDPETELARRMADSLCLDFHVVSVSSDSIRRVLNSSGRVYPQPFCDPAMIATSHLHSYLKEHHSERHILIDGVGADTLFGVLEKARQWRKLSTIPDPLMSLLAETYGLLGLERSVGKFEHVARIIRRAQQFGPIVAGGMARNPLADIIYRFDEATVSAVCHAIEEWIGVYSYDEMPVRYSETYLMHGTAGIVLMHQYASISSINTHQSGWDKIRALSPFIDPSLVGLLHGPAHCMLERDGGKGALKRLLARHVPRDLVYRKKTGIRVPLAKMFAQDPLREILDDILETNFSIFGGNFEKAAATRLFRHAMAGLDLPINSREFLWTVLFTHMWLKENISN